MAGPLGDTHLRRAGSSKRFERRMHQLGIRIDHRAVVEFDQVRFQHHPLAAHIQENAPR